ncbi:MAG: acyl-CoA thioesterase [Gammaproteobacteria bacterium HGW-Gammaproteobacteria-4]|jgi:acyl-CoA thioester hydrolase|nr:MAG: acyl-CoA thioesterase [Gammaproteobacteria bacterium HGW-Gammaproteobacteria-4]
MSNEQNPALTGHVLARIAMPVRWRDLDAFNHVNNASYLTYLEEARLQWLGALPGPWLDSTSAPVLAAIQINYRRPIEWPQDLVVELRCLRLGNSSLRLGHRIVAAGATDTLYSDGEVVMVWIDRASGKSAALPESVRAACAVADGNSLDSATA